MRQKLIKVLTLGALVVGSIKAQFTSIGTLTLGMTLMHQDKQNVAPYMLGPDVSFIGVWNPSTWFGVGLIGSIGGALSLVPREKVQEVMNAKFGITFKHFNTYLSAGFKGGLNHAFNQSGLRGLPRFDGGYFAQVMLVSPLPYENWQFAVVLEHSNSLTRCKGVVKGGIGLTYRFSGCE